MKRAEFVHLHNHTEFSLLDGALRVSQMIARAHEYHMPALAITDHGNLFGAVSFYHQAMDAGVKPLIGCEVYVAPGDRRQKHAGRGAAEATMHLLLLARNRVGYQNLVRLVSKGYLEGFYYRPRVDKDLLEEHAEGLLALSACLKGEIPRLILAGKQDRAREAAAFYRDLFGPGNFYLEVMNHGLAEEALVLRELKELGQEMGLPLVATNDCHYLAREQAKSHDVLLCLQTGKDLDDPRRLRFSGDTFYFRSPDEMATLFAEVPQALSATLEVSEKCNVDLQPARFQLPDFSLPPGYADAADYLRDLAKAGLEQRYGEVSEECSQRLDFELGTIRKMGFGSYFLIIKDLIDAARLRGIPVGPGRGSVAGSLVSYALEITDVDPLEHDLLFERFLNPERITMPDIDIDFCYERRNEIIEYAREKYGAGSLSQIITFGTMAARAVIRDVGRVMRVPYAEVDRLAKLVPAEVNMTLERALERVSELRRLAEESPVYAELLDHARSLEGMARHASTHAAGVVIAPGELTDYVPLFQSSKGEVTTQYDMNALEKLGLLKVDLLGLRTLTVTYDTVKLIEDRHGVKIDPRAIPLEDPAVYELLSVGNTVGVFQLESAGMRDLLRRLRPDRFEDVVAVNALYRPGPLGSDMVDDFIRGKQGKKIRYLHPDLEPILRSTYGVILYQEQVMAIAHRLAGFTLGQADLLRRAMGKKIRHVMAEQRQTFITGAGRNGVTEDRAEKIFDLMAHFAGYGFNKSHSAAYAVLSVTTAYLKTHHPREFMAATMNSEMGDTDRLLVLADECRRMGIPVLPPDINASRARFTVVDEGIRFGLAAVKNVGLGSVEAMMEARREGPFTTLFDFTARVDSSSINRRVMESLVQAGAFDLWGENRATLHASVSLALDYGQKIQRDRERGQVSLFGEETGGGPSEIEPRLEYREAWSRREFLSREKDALGFYISGHPMEGYDDVLAGLSTIPLAELKERSDGETVGVAGLVVAYRRITDRKGKEMAFLSLEDRTGTTEVILFSDVYERASGMVVDGKALLVSGRLSSREEEEPKLIAREVKPLEEAEEATRDASPTEVSVPSTTLHLSLGDDVGEDILPRLVELVGRYPGETPILIHVRTDSAAEVDITSAQKVSPTPELIEELTALLGPGRARLS